MNKTWLITYRVYNDIIDEIKQDEFTATTSEEALEMLERMVKLSTHYKLNIEAQQVVEKLT